MITIKHMKKEFPNATPLRDVNVEIHKGDVISVIGPSGTGKSTLIRCLNMLDPPTAGEIIVDGVVVTDKDCDISKIRQKMGMVFQSFNLFHHMTVIENLMAAPMDLLGKSKQEAYERGMELLRAVGLSDRALNYPDELSGGQKQRVAIARTLAMDPEIILFDEPTSALDPTTIGEVERVIKGLASRGLTMIVVTHDMRFAKEVANRVFYMDDGGIYEDGPPEQIFDHPQKERTIRFIRQRHALEEYIDSKHFDFLGMLSSIDAYCLKQGLSQKTINRIQSAFEEVVAQIVLPALSPGFSLKLVLEYDTVQEIAGMIVKYDGDLFNPLESEDDLSLCIARSVTSKIEYEVIDEAPYTNLVKMEIR